MRHAWLFAVFVAAPALLVEGSALARPKRPATTTTTAATLPATRADPMLVAKSALTKEPPKLAAADRAVLDAVVRELRADRLDAALARYRAWAGGAPKALSREDVEATALWAFRAGVLARHDDVAASADQIRFLDERSAALDDSIALLRAAAVAKKPVLVARIVVLTPYAREQRGNEMRERQIGHDDYEAEIGKLTAPADQARADREKARAGFVADAKLLACLGELVKAASYAKLRT